MPRIVYKLVKKVSNIWIHVSCYLVKSYWHGFEKKIFSILAEEMLHAKDYFKHGKLDKDGLVNFIKDVKKNTKLSDEDAAILAASK